MKLTRRLFFLGSLGLVKLKAAVRPSVKSFQLTNDLNLPVKLRPGDRLSVRIDNNGSLMQPTLWLETREVERREAMIPIDPHIHGEQTAWIAPKEMQITGWRVSCGTPPSR